MRKTAKTTFYLSPLQLITLINNVHLGAKDPRVGFEDADNSLRQITYALQGRRRFKIKRSILESALWSCNMNDEVGKFWHPYVNKTTFDDFIEKLDIEDSTVFDKTYNLITDKALADQRPKMNPRRKPRGRKK